MIDWKHIIALAILVLPITYCTMEETKRRANKATELQLACIAGKGNWEVSWGGYCEFK